MIQNALNFLKEELNAYLSKTFNISDEIVFITNINKSDVKLSSEFINAVSLMHINIHEEKAIQSPKIIQNTDDSTVGTINPQLNLNLTVLVVTNFEKYTESLKYLDAILLFFQSKNYFSKEDSSFFPTGNLQSLRINLETLSMEEQFQMWGMLGISYVPYLIYKLRMLAVQDNRIISKTKKVSGIDYKISRK